MAKLNSTANKPPRKTVSLDHWVGKDEYVGTGVSSDPQMRWGEPKAGVSTGPGKEKKGPPAVEIE